MFFYRLGMGGFALRNGNLGTHERLRRFDT